MLVNLLLTNDRRQRRRLHQAEPRWLVLLTFLSGELQQETFWTQIFRPLCH